MAVLVKAPGVVKLLGEHAVVYGKLSVAAAVSLYASASTKSVKSKKFALKLSDLGESARFSPKELSELYSSYSSKQSPVSYVEHNSAMGTSILPYATIASRLQEEFSAQVAGQSIRVKSNIPKQSGLASSASCYTAFTVALVKATGVKLSEEQIIDVARDGERVAHTNEGAGRIDVNTSFYGGYVSYSQSQGVKKESYEVQPKLLLVNTGPKKPTSETIGHISAQYKEHKEETEILLNKIEECSRNGLAALGNKNLKELGKIMQQDQALLKQLGVSSAGLDRCVEVAIANGAYGAKLSGGGGGGIAVVLIKNGAKKLKTSLEKEGFAVFKSKISADGAVKFLS